MSADGKIQPVIGIIGGTGLDSDDSVLKDKCKVEVPTTRFGDPSDKTLVSGTISGLKVYILARHGSKHNVNPSNINYSANIWTLKQLGCTHIIATNAVGSLREEYAPGQLSVLDQFIDQTKGRSKHTLYPIIHVPSAYPYDSTLNKMLIESANELNHKIHPSGTMVVIEGPRYSSLAESKMYRQMGGHLINMTGCPEVTLASEAGIIYSTLCLVTDYDCWHESPEEQVTVELVGERLKILSTKAKEVLAKTVEKLAAHDWTEKIRQKQIETEAAIMAKDW